MEITSLSLSVRDFGCNVVFAPELQKPVEIVNFAEYFTVSVQDGRLKIEQSAPYVRKVTNLTDFFTSRRVLIRLQQSAFELLTVNCCAYVQINKLQLQQCSVKAVAGSVRLHDCKVNKLLLKGNAASFNCETLGEMENVNVNVNRSSLHFSELSVREAEFNGDCSACNFHNVQITEKLNLELCNTSFSWNDPPQEANVDVSNDNSVVRYYGRLLHSGRSTCQNDDVLRLNIRSNNVNSSVKLG